jgi:hypothetical protein
MSKVRLEGTDWHFRSDEPISFGCGGCYLRNICGGLRVKGPALDCQRFCCHEPDCQVVCFNSPAIYAKRLKEIGGFELDQIPKCEAVEFERSRGFVPLIHHASSRRELLQNDAVAVSLFELVDRDGAPKYFSRQEIVANFRVSPKAKLFVSGVQKDHLLERIWRSQHRNSIAAMLKSLEVELFTPPNFSVYNNVPRSENLYNY